MLAKILLLVLAIQRCLAQSDEVPGTLQVPALFLPAPAADFACNGGYASGCKDCRTQQQCLGALDPVVTACASPTPYCTSGSCSASIDPEATCTYTPLTCSGEGTFPDPTACQLYHYCSQSGIASDVYVCPIGYVFNAATLLCKKSSLAADCVSIKCPAQTGLAAYGTSKTFYAVCIYDGAAVSTILMLKCSDGATWDGANCVYQCKKEGNFADTNDSTQYYQCYVLNGKWAYNHLSCVSGKKFDATKQVCV